MQKTIEQTIRNNSEILDKLGQDMQIIAAYGNISPALKKRMYTRLRVRNVKSSGVTLRSYFLVLTYSALYWAKYAMDINHNVLRETGKKP